jgi:hypothetical protein
MAIDQTNVVDSIGFDPNKDEAQLIITDHLGWAEGEREDKEHLYLLQEKINSYLRFIESGEIYSAYPKAEGKTLLIRVIAKFDMPTNAKEFFSRVQEELLASGYKITFERLNLS